MDSWSTSKILFTTSFGQKTQFWGHYPTVAPFAWESSKAILFDFTQNCCLWDFVGGVYNFLGSFSPQQKFEAMDGPMLQLSFIWQTKEKTSSRSEGGQTQKMQREAKHHPPPRPHPRLNFVSSFYMLFLCILSLPYVNWASQKGYLFYLRSSLWFSDLPLSYFRRLFPSLSFSHRHSGLLFPILTT